jgi:LacI family transcriptional regulator
VVTVSNELSPEHRAALADGVIDLVLGTPQTAIASAVVQAMRQRLSDMALGSSPTPLALPLVPPVELWTAENL